MRTPSSTLSIALGALLLALPFRANGENRLPAGNVIISDTKTSNSLVTLHIPPIPGNNKLYKQTSEWARYKKLRAGGWSAFFVGGALMAIGSIGYIIDNWEGPGHKNGGLFIAGGGAALTAASVPLLIIAYKNRRKAIALGATNQALHLPLHGETRQTALAVCLSF